ncbi:MAG TPA: 4Fe-4S dicluster domain-containing protein [Ktedonobacterales bacterium]
MHRSRTQVAEELSACICCNECLLACPALPTQIQIETLNRETLADSISLDVARFAHACYQCGACVPVCPVGLHRDSMMFWLKMRLAGGNSDDSTSGIGGKQHERASWQDELDDPYEGRATPWR